MGSMFLEVSIISRWRQWEGMGRRFCISICAVYHSGSKARDHHQLGDQLIPKTSKYMWPNLALPSSAHICLHLVRGSLCGHENLATDHCFQCPRPFTGTESLNHCWICYLSIIYLNRERRCHLWRSHADWFHSSGRRHSYHLESNKAGRDLTPHLMGEETVSQTGGVSGPQWRVGPPAPAHLSFLILPAPPTAQRGGGE